MDGGVVEQITWWEFDVLDVLFDCETENRLDSGHRILRILIILKYHIPDLDRMAAACD